MTKLTALLSIIVLSKFSFSQVCPCNASTPFDHQERTDAKHVSNFNGFVTKDDTINTTYITKWDKKYNATTKNITIKANSSNGDRQPNTPEDTLYTLKGFMWFVKQEDNDCDFHIEIGPSKTNAGAIRIVVEVPKENEVLQKKIKDHLDAIGEKILGCGTSKKDIAHFDVPIPVVVTGLGFYDASHKPPKTNHGDVHTNKRVWELHPVTDIVFL